MTVLELKNVTYRYGESKQPLLKNINIAFESDKTYALAGNSGMERNALLSLIAGLHFCTDGEILFRGKGLKTLDCDDYRSKRIGMAFGNLNLLPKATALENVVLSMNIGGIGDKDLKSAAYAVLERVGIERRVAERKISCLKDDLQRVAVACAISHNPDIVIVDESVLYLGMDISDILTSVARDDGKCVIIATDIQRTNFTVDEIWGINHGRLLFMK